MKTLLKVGAATVGLFVLFALLWSLRAGVWVEVVNLEPFALRQVSVQTTGGSRSIGDIAIGDSQRVKVRARGESSVFVSYLDSKGVRQTLDADCYIESGNYGNIQVQIQNGKALRTRHDTKITPFG